MIAQNLKVVLVSALIFISGAGAFAAGPKQTYRKSDIADARYGAEGVEEFMALAAQVAERLNARIFGQETATQMLEDRLIQYASAYGQHKGQPVALNLIGLPGIGKTGMFQILIDMGIPFITYNAQNYVNPEKDFAGELKNALRSRDTDTPIVVLIDELDKLPEITNNDEPEKTTSLVGALNQILSEGTLPGAHGQEMNVANVMFVTTMNFSPTEMENFSEEVLKGRKNFYDFTIEDFEAFDTWLRESTSSTYKILSHLFRSNTVSRLAPNTVVMQPLSLEVHKQIAKLILEQSIATATTKEGTARRLEVTYDPALLEYIANEAIYAPAGARQTIVRAKALTDQMIRFGSTIAAPGADPMVDRPRRIHLSLQDGQAAIVVTPRLQAGNQLKDGTTFSEKLAYNRATQLFNQPKTLVKQKPTYDKTAATKTEKPITKKEIAAARFPANARIGKDIEDAINYELLGQEDAVKIVLEDMRKYLGRMGPAAKEPSARILSGFPGIGKSELVRLVGFHLGLPIIKLNMQQFSSDSPQTVKDFLVTLQGKIEEMQFKVAYDDAYKYDKKQPKYILLIEELDKVFEINPDTGRVENRPIMAFIKDLLNDGQLTLASEEYGSVDIDVRDAFIFTTMNFAVDRFGFDADPRMTSLDDVMDAWNELNGTPTTLKKLLGSMFLPETVSRMLSQFMILRPLERRHFVTLIERQINKVVKDRLINEKGRNVGQIDIKLTKAYKDYLFNETVIPSEGARHTVKSVQGKIASDIEAALANIPRSGPLATAPLILTLDFRYGKNEVVVRANLKSDVEAAAAAKTAAKVAAKSAATSPEADVPTAAPAVVAKAQTILRRPVELLFPPPQVAGRVEGERLFTAAHEFGHAYMALRLGIRITDIVAVPPEPGIGGYVKYAQNAHSAQEIVGQVYSALASRAMERIFSSNDPQNPNSVMAITAGPSSDIQQATMGLFNAIYELGFDPAGGTIDRNFVKGPGKYADYASLPPELAEKLGFILRDLEHFMVKEFTTAHNEKWYVDRIVKVAQAGAMNEKQFFDLVGYYYPGPVRDEEGQGVPAHFREVFKKYIVPEPKRITRAHTQKLAAQPMSINDSIDLYMNEFARLVALHLHGVDGGGPQVTPATQAPTIAKSAPASNTSKRTRTPKGACDGALTKK